MRRRGDLWEDYGSWILHRVGFFDRRHDLLMEELHNFKFVSYVNFDDNRVRDGIGLRSDFLNDRAVSYKDYVGDFRDHFCSVLEVLAALAIRIEEEYIGDPKEFHPEHIFWEMICNLGLDRYDDSWFKPRDIYDILDTWMRREFSRNGEGSIFPLKRTRRDQRKIQIWDQMNEYLLENYPM